MRKVYISGKITGLNIEFARANFKKAERMLQARGYETVNPFDSGVDEDAPWEHHMCVDLENLRKCEYMYQMKNWTASRGAICEYEEAIKAGIKILRYENGDIVEMNSPISTVIYDTEVKENHNFFHQEWVKQTTNLNKNDSKIQQVMKDGINNLRDACYNNSLEAGWHTDLETGKLIERNKPEMMMLIVSEVAEAMEGERKGLMDDHLPHRSMVEVEMADAVIRIMDYCGRFSLDIGGAIVEKIEYNKNRSDHKLENRRSTNGKKF